MNVYIVTNNFYVVESFFLFLAYFYQYLIYNYQHSLMEAIIFKKYDMIILVIEVGYSTLSSIYNTLMI